MTGILFLLLSIWAGFILEHRYYSIGERNFWFRLSAAILFGTFFSTWLTFSLSLIIGFNLTTVLVTLFLILFFIIYNSAVHGTNMCWFREDVFTRKSLPLIHIFLLLFIMPYFIFGLWETKAGDILFAGNYNDLSYHMSITSAFLEQSRFLPDHPQCAGAKMSYHFLVDFHSAILARGGLNLFYAVVIPQVLHAFALATMIYYFYFQMLARKIRVFFAAALLIMGHIGLFNVVFALLGYSPYGMHLNLYSWASVRDHLLFYFFNYMDPIINYFHPQRPFLFAFPFALGILLGIYKLFISEQPATRKVFCLALLLGLTPLFHIHTFLVLAPVFGIAACLMRLGFKKTMMSLLPLLLASGQIWFILSQPKARGFSGFDVHKMGGGLQEINVLGSLFLSRILFWIRAAGFPLILGSAGCIMYFKRHRTVSLSSPEGRRNLVLIIFLSIPFMFFIVINFYRFTPNWGDSNKFFLYFTVILSLFAGYFLGRCFEKNAVGKLFSVVIILIAAIVPSFLETYTVFTRPGSLLFSACEQKVAQWVKANTPAEALFLTSDDVIHYLPALTGRRVVDGAYTWNTGFRKPNTEFDVQQIYKTGDARLMRKYRVTYVVIGPQERRRFAIKEQQFERFKVVYNQVCDGMSYKVYDVSQYIPGAVNGTVAKNGAAIKIGKKVFLSDLIPESASQSYGTLKYDKNFYDQPIILKRKKYAKGLGTHSTSEIVYLLNRQFKYFESDIGLDDTEANTKGSVIFKVYVDENLKYESPIMRGDMHTEQVKINITSAHELKLVVEDAGDGDTCDHASWADAAVY